MIDVFHIYEENDLLIETALKAGKRLGYVHIADNDRFTPGKRKINLKEFVKALKDVNCDGYMIMEFNPGSCSDESLRRAAQYLKKLL